MGYGANHFGEHGALSECDVDLVKTGKLIACLIFAPSASNSAVINAVFARRIIANGNVHSWQSGRRAHAVRGCAMNRLAADRMPQNRLLSSLRSDDLTLLIPDLKAVELLCGTVLAAPNAPIRHAYLPVSGIVSVVMARQTQKNIEVAIIGREGMTGVEAFLGANRLPYSTVVQNAGQAERIEIAALRRAMNRSASLQRCLLRFAGVLMIQSTYSALAGAQGTLLERVARRLLMVHDRTNGNQLPLTHESLAVALSVQRTGVTLTLNRLEERGLLTIKRGSVIIRDCLGLKAVTNGLYGVPEREYRRLFGQRAKHI